MRREGSKEGIAMSAARQGFPTTRRTALERTGCADEEVRRQAYETLVTCYWKPVYKYLRLRWGLATEDARDATQEFFLQAMQKEFFQDYDPSRARFRTYLRLRLDTLILKQRRSAGRLKRGAEYQIVPVDFDRAEGELMVPVHTPASSVEEHFHREWLHGIVELAVATLRAHAMTPPDACPMMPEAPCERRRWISVSDAASVPETARTETMLSHARPSANDVSILTGASLSQLLPWA